MGIVFRQSVKTTIVIFTGAALGALFNYVRPYVLTQQSFGFIQTLTNLGAVVQYIILLGVGLMLPTFIARYPVGDERRKVLTTFSLIIPILSTVVFTLIYALLKSRIIGLYQVKDQPFIETYYYWMPLQVLFWAFLSFWDMYLMAQEKIAIAAFMREIVVRLCNILLIALFYFKLISFSFLVAGTLLCYAVPAGILMFIASRTKGFGFSFNWKVFTKSEYKEIIHFSWYHLLSGVSIFVLGYIDSLMLGPLDETGLNSVAIYTIAIFIVSVMIIPYRAILWSAYATLNRAFIEQKMDELKNLFHRSSINILIASIAMFVLIACNLNNAVAILPAEYQSIKPLVLILMLGRLADMASGLNNEVISISSHYKFNFRLSALLLAMVFVLDRVFIPQYGVYGAAWATTISLIVFNIIKTIFIRKKLDLFPFTKKSMLVILAGSAAGAAGWLIPFIINPIADAAIRSVIILIVYVLMLILLKPSEDLQVYLTNVRRNKRLF